MEEVNRTEIARTEVNRKNTVTFAESIKILTETNLEQHKRIDGLLNMISTLSERMNTLEQLVRINNAMHGGRGPSVKE